MRNRNYKQPQDADVTVSTIEKGSECSPGLEAQPLQAMIAVTPDAIIAIDEHFQIFDLNPAATKTLNSSREEALGRRCSEVIKCQNLNHMLMCGTSSCPHERVVQQKQALANEEMIIGGSCEVSASITPVPVGDNQFVVFTARDISAL